MKPIAAISVLFLALPAVHTSTTVAAENYMPACCAFQIASRKNSI